jgi:hypothetical protein
MALISNESEMALISEWMQQCGKKVLDNAGIVRDSPISLDLASPPADTIV